MRNLVLVLVLISNLSYSQDLLALLDSAIPEPTVYTNGTFKTVRLINGYTSETAGKNDLVFSISHRFGTINGGVYEFYGLDESNIRFGFEYGLNNRISLAVGRSNYEKLYDGFFKFKLFRQSTGSSSFPVTVTWLSGMALKSVNWANPEFNYPYSARLYYTHELLISRKFNNKFSAQLVPALVHRNMVKTKKDQNLVFALGFGANYTVNNWLSISGEYYALMPGETDDNHSNSFAIGVDMETGGGHIFQVHLSNSRGMTEKAFIPETTELWSEGDIRIGFNIIRVFPLKKK